jgi:hypothetical protein
MTPEENEILKNTYELSKENNKILRGIRRSNRWSLIFRVLYWTLIIGVSVGAFYFIQPYINTITGAYSNLQDNLDTVKSATSNLPSWLK